MVVVVKDMHKMLSTGNIYGYCSCGREVKYSRNYMDKECPLCGAELTWECFEEEGEDNVKDI